MKKATIKIRKKGWFKIDIGYDYKNITLLPWFKKPDYMNIKKEYGNKFNPKYQYARILHIKFGIIGINICLTYNK